MVNTGLTIMNGIYLYGCKRTEGMGVRLVLDGKFHKYDTLSIGNVPQKQVQINPRLMFISIIPA